MQQDNRFIIDRFGRATESKFSLYSSGILTTGVWTIFLQFIYNLYFPISHYLLLHPANVCEEFFLQLDQYSATNLENEEFVSISFEGSSYSKSFPIIITRKKLRGKNRKQK